MGRWMKTLKPYMLSILVVIGLLVVQAACELTLPDYTSKIIDTGIQGYGIEHVCPEKIVASEYESAKLFMDENEKKLWEDAYEKKGDIYEIRYTDKKTLDNLDKELAISLVLDSQVSKMDEEALMKVLEERDDLTPEALGITEYPVDLRPIFKNMQDSGELDGAMLEEMKVKVGQQLDAMGGEALQISMGKAYAKVLDEQAGVDIYAKQQAYLWSTGGIMIVIAVIMAVAMILTSLFASKIGACVGRDLRGSIYSRVMKFSNAEIEKFSTASLITRTTNDIQNIQMTTTLALRLALFSPVMAIGGVIRVASTGAGMWWVIAVAILAIIAIIIFLFSLVMPKFAIVQKLVDNINRITREIITGLPVIRAFGTEKREEERFKGANMDLYKVQIFINRAISFMYPAFMFVMFGVSTLIVWVGAHRIDDGFMRVGQMTAFITYTMQIIMSFIMLTVMAVMIPRAAIAAKRVDEVIRTRSSINNKPDAVKMNDPKGTVEFENVCFTYPGADGEVLTDISFTAEAGKTTAIIGSTGCGKSTLIQLIPRLYDASAGEVKIDGVNVKDIELKSLRENIGYVPQKGILFSGTIRSNISYGNTDASEEDIEEAAAIAQANDFIERKEDGYDSPISQGGTNVSGGQKQRLAIARALAKHPKIFIFDDSFSALDLKTDRKLREALKEKVGERTVIIVAQRVSTILNADLILVMDEGKIVGRGTHRELIASCKTYKEIAESQLSPEEINRKGVSTNA